VPGEYEQLAPKIGALLLGPKKKRAIFSKIWPDDSE
jgi:hypothetical protein